MADVTNSDPWATPDDIAAVWRPLNTAQADRARALIEVISRAIRRRWPDSTRDRLIVPGMMDDITDVVVFSVLPFMEQDPADPTPIPSNAKSFQQTSGAESVSVTLDGPLAGRLAEFAPWMVSVFEPGILGPETGAQPVYSFPPVEDFGIDWIQPRGYPYGSPR